MLNVEGFEKRVVYNVAQGVRDASSAPADDYPSSDDVVGVTICDFELWPEKDARGPPRCRC